MDYPCEPAILKKTKGTARKHIDKTVRNVIRTHKLIQEKYPHLKEKFIPVIQGWRIKDYATCVEKYKQAGIWGQYSYWAVGSVCRRNSIKEIRNILKAIKREGGDKKLHAFGVKISVLKDRTIRNILYSCDSSAWSFEAMYTREGKGTMPKEIRSLSNALRYEVVFYLYMEKVKKALNKNGNENLEKYIKGDNK